MKGRGTSAVEGLVSRSNWRESSRVLSVSQRKVACLLQELSFIPEKPWSSFVLRLGMRRGKPLLA